MAPSCQRSVSDSWQRGNSGLADAGRESRAQRLAVGVRPQRGDTPTRCADEWGSGGLSVFRFACRDCKCERKISLSDMASMRRCKSPGSIRGLDTRRIEIKTPRQVTRGCTWGDALGFCVLSTTVDQLYNSFDFVRYSGEKCFLNPIK